MSAMPLLAIFGPTSVGKTEIAIEISDQLAATAVRAAAVSADAYAVYSEIPIITGAPTSDQQERLTTSCVGIRSVTESFSVGSFSTHAHSEVDRIRAAGGVPIVVGGTGLYLRAAVSVLDLLPPVDPAIRERLILELAEHGSTQLHQRLGLLAPLTAEGISEGDSQRIVRALELLEAGVEPTERPTAGLWATPARIPTVAVGLTMDRETQRGLISDRIDSMLDLGAEREVAEAWELGPSSTASAAIGMRELRDADLDRMRFRTWQLAKRQMTWLRRLDDVVLIDVTGRSSSDVAEEVLAIYAGPRSA